MPLEGGGCCCRCCGCDGSVDDVAAEDWLEEGKPLQLPIFPFIFGILCLSEFRVKSVVDSEFGDS